MLGCSIRSSSDTAHGAQRLPWRAGTERSSQPDRPVDWQGNDGLRTVAAMRKDDGRVDHAPPLQWLLVLALAWALVAQADGSVPPARSAPATSQQSLPTLPGNASSRLLVLPNPGRESDAEALHQVWRARVLHRLARLGGWQVVELPQDTDLTRVLEAYRRHRAIQLVEPDAPIQAAQTLPNDPFFQNGAQWHLNNYGQNGGLPDVDVDGPEAWDVVREAPGVIVAILDTGIRWTHEDLAPNLWRNPRDGSFGLNPIGRSHDPWDDNGHGTHVAGLIGAVANNQRGVAGVAWRVQLMAIKVLDSAGNGWFSDAVVGVEFALTNGARVLNVSWTSSTNSAAFSNALWHAGRAGAVVVAAAGNSPINLDIMPLYPAALRLPHQLTVAASTRSDDRYLQSAYGPATVDLYAPGVTMYSTLATGNAAYGTLSGTSMAAAVTSGAVALTCQRFPTAPPEEIVARIRAAVEVRPAFEGRCRTGGRLNLRKVVDLPGLRIQPGPTPLLWVSGTAGHAYEIHATTNLVHWQPVTSRILTAAEEPWIDPEATAWPVRFYRGVPAP